MIKNQICQHSANIIFFFPVKVFVSNIRCNACCDFPAVFWNEQLNKSWNQKLFLWDETAPGSFIVIKAHCRIATISQTHCLRFLSADPMKQHALYVSCPWWRSNRSAYLWYCSAGSVLMHWDNRLWVNMKTPFVLSCTKGTWPALCACTQSCWASFVLVCFKKQKKTKPKTGRPQREFAEKCSPLTI